MAHVLDLQPRANGSFRQWIRRNRWACTTLALVFGLACVTIRSYYRWDGISWSLASGTKDALHWQLLKIASASGGLSIYWTSSSTDQESINEYYRWHPHGVEAGDEKLDKPQSFWFQPDGAHYFGVEFICRR
jgi:hypothetical protein